MINLLCCKDKEEFLTQRQGRKIILVGSGALLSEAYDELHCSDESITVCSNGGLDSIMCDKKMKTIPFEALREINESEELLVITLQIGEFILLKEKIESMLIGKNVDAYLYYSFRKEKSLLCRSIERQKKILKRREKLGETEARKKAEAVIPKDKFIIPKLNILVTEKCSLRCKDCRALIPYVVNPQDEPLEKVVHEVKQILEAVDGVVDVEPIGGEPFLYPYLVDLLKFLCSQEKIMNVCITTNGTIVPNQECLNALKNEKVFVYISDYGYIDKMAKVVATFEREKISFVTETDQQWLDVGGFECRNRTLDELKLEYLNCFGEFVLKYVWDNRIWLCPRAPRLSTLNVFESPHDYIELSKFSSSSELRDAIEHSFFEVYAEACNYCNQGDYDIKTIPAGRQIDDTRSPSRFTIVDRAEYEQLLKK